MSKEDQSEQKITPIVSSVLGDGRIVEMLYRPNTRSTTFAVFGKGDWVFQSHIDEGNKHLVPFSAENNLIKNEAVLLPSEPHEYGDEGELVAGIQGFLHRYTDLSPEFETVATYYVVLSWLYDAFNELPYLRLRGDFGSGKTRTLLTIGSVCYKPFFASGASTVSPIFHTLNAFRGTLIFDEADFRFSDERAEIVKILNNGNVRGLPVLRTMMNRQREFNPQAFQVFGPKIVATRNNYTDKGLESRFLTEEMGLRRLRTDIPINLPEQFKDEARDLRNRLLLFRFRMLAKVSLDSSLADVQLEPRLNQILVPLLSIIRDERARESVRWMAQRAQSDLVAERGLRVEAQILEILSELMAHAQGVGVAVSKVVSGLTERYGFEYERPITSRWIGGILRGRLSFRTYKSHGVYVVPTTERAKLDLLCTRFGLSKPGEVEQSVQLGDMGTTGT